MKNSIRLFLAFAASAILLASCKQLTSGGVTVSGTVTTNGTLITGTTTITVTTGSDTFSASFSPPPLDGSNSQTQQFSIPNVPTGTYQVTLEYVGNEGYSYTCTVDGQDVTINWSNPQSGVYDLSIDGVSVQADTTVDLYLGNLG